jgi:hypothetical protein
MPSIIGQAPREGPGELFGRVTRDSKIEAQSYVAFLVILVPGG